MLSICKKKNIRYGIESKLLYIMKKSVHISTSEKYGFAHLGQI